MQYTNAQKIRHIVIRSRWTKWLIPLLCSLPYIISLFWLVSRGQLWIAQIMLAPLVMLLAVITLGLVLAKLEFRR